MKGELFFNGKDAWTTYGIGLQFGAYVALISPAPAKDYVTNTSRTENGTEYAAGMRFDERNISLPLNITAKDRASFFAAFTRFTNEVCAAGDIRITTKYDSSIYKCKYKSVAALTEYNGRKGTFSLNLTEPDPTDRKI